MALAGLPGLAALVALIPAYLSIRATDAQIQIAQQGEVTAQYNAAITNLGSSSIEVRLGGIYALQRLMQETPAEQATVVAVLCAFVRDQTSRAASPTNPPGSQMPTDVQAALTVVGTRDTGNDGPTTFVDFYGAQIPDAGLGFTKLTDADFDGANLKGADLAGANLTGALVRGADLTGADLNGANLDGALLSDSNLRGADFTSANLTHTSFLNSDLTGAKFVAVNLTNAYLSGANLTGADLACAIWPSNVPPPTGWLRNRYSGQLGQGGLNSITCMRQ